MSCSPTSTARIGGCRRKKRCCWRNTRASGAILRRSWRSSPATRDIPTSKEIADERTDNQGRITHNDPDRTGQVGEAIGTNPFHLVDGTWGGRRVVDQRHHCAHHLG